MNPPPVHLPALRAPLANAVALIEAGSPDAPAFIDETGHSTTYRQLRELVDGLSLRLGGDRQLVLMACGGGSDEMAHLVALLAAGHAVVLLAAERPQSIDEADARFLPSWHARRDGAGMAMRRVRPSPPALHPELALLLSTSGSTGAGKSVRLSYANLLANAASIAQYLQVTASEHALLTLPVHYSYGLSVVTSHLLRGATVLVSGRSFTDAALWRFFDAHGGTNISGVPHSYQLLDRLIDGLALPTLRFMTQAGGRLPADLVVRYAQRAQARGARFYVMYGQTEASPRIAWLPPEQVLAHPDCIGLPVPGGRLSLVDEAGNEVVGNGVEGEIVYRGPNVMMGYATGAADLAAPPGPAELRTGDLGRRTADGLYQVTGRRSRFLKLFGLRIALDELERRLEAMGQRVVCTGDDDRLVMIALRESAAPDLRARVAACAGLPPHAIRLVVVDAVPRLPSGKVDYAAARALAGAADSPASAPAPASGVHGSTAGKTAPDSVRAAYARLFPGTCVHDDSTFNALGGDSLTYVEASMDLERMLPTLPNDWTDRSVAELEALRAPPGPLAQVETSIVLRAAAIVTIVSNHFHWFVWPGGAFFLMALAGWNFGRFTIESTVRRNSVRPVLLLAAAIAAPTLLSIWARSARTGTVEWRQMLLLGNFVEPQQRYTPLYWFPEVLVQLLLVAALVLAWPAARRAVATRPWAAPAALLAVGGVLAGAGPHLWDTHALSHWVPHMMLWMFALGWLMQASRSGPQRAAAVSLAVLLPLIAAMGQVNSDDSRWVLWWWVGTLLLMSRRTLPVPRALSPAVHAVAAASLFIFLVHFDALRWLERLDLLPHPALAVAAGVALGLAMWWAWRQAMQLLRSTARARRPDIDFSPTGTNGA